MKSILFTEDMFTDVVEGRKTQTRRLCTDDVHMKLWGMENTKAYFTNLQDGEPSVLKPKYKVGEVVYLKEPYCFNGDRIVYRFLDANPLPKHYYSNKLFMPAEYARYFIRITDVRCEELNSISDADAKAEGVEFIKDIYGIKRYKDYCNDNIWVSEGNKSTCPAAEYSFRSLWAKLYGHEAMMANPWLWAYSFERA